jgi:hypothetical protein
MGIATKSIVYNSKTAILRQIYDSYPANNLYNISRSKISYISIHQISLIFLFYLSSILLHYHFLQIKMKKNFIYDSFYGDKNILIDIIL